MSKEYVVKIMAWKKYQNREVKTKTSWLRLENDFIESPNFSEFSSDERMVWLYLLCCASKLNSENIQVPHQCSHRVLHRCTGIDEKVFHRAIEKLKRLRIVEIRTTRGRYADDTSVNAHDTRTTHYEDETLRYETLRDEDETKDFSSERSTERIGTAPALSELESVLKERQVRREVQDRWLLAFPDPAWVIGEVHKALAWETSNPSRRKKNFAAFITRWLTKGWDFRKTPGPSGAAIDWDKVFGKEAS